MFQINDHSYINAMAKMSKLIQNIDSMNQWFDAKKLEFDLLEKD